MSEDNVELTRLERFTTRLGMRWGWGPSWIILDAVGERLQKSRHPPPTSDGESLWVQPACSALHRLGRVAPCAAAALFVCIPTLDILSGGIGGLTLLYLLPVGLVAVLYGVAAGLAAGVFAAILAPLGGVLDGSPLGAGAYVVLGSILLLFGGLNGAFRDKSLRALPLYSIVWPISALVFLVTAMIQPTVGNVPSEVDESLPEPFRVVNEMRLEQPLSTDEALKVALSGDLPGSYRLREAGDNEAQYREVLAELNALVEDAGSRRDEITVLADELTGAVNRNELDPDFVIKVIGGALDPSLGVRSLHSLHEQIADALGGDQQEGAATLFKLACALVDRERERERERECEQPDDT